MAKTILVVEDESQVRSLVRVVLSDAGYSIVEAPDGTVALRELRKRRGRVSTVVTDIDMGRMNGLELAQEIKQWFPAVPIVFISALPVLPDELNKAAPGSAFLKKPFDATTLVATVRKVIEQRAP